MAPQRRSHAWALLTDASAVPLSELSDQAWEGLGYARRLAEDAKERARQNVRDHEPFPPLTVAELAEAAGKSPATIGRLIARARKELFGDVTDAAIYKRRQRAKEQHARKATHCH